MNTTATHALQQRAASAFFAAVLTVAMLAGIGGLAAAGSDNAAPLAATQHQLLVQPT